MLLDSKTSRMFQLNLLFRLPCFDGAGKCNFQKLQRWKGWCGWQSKNFNFDGNMRLTKEGQTG